VGVIAILTTLALDFEKNSDDGENSDSDEKFLPGGKLR
jgi:hypothetical protein